MQPVTATPPLTPAPEILGPAPASPKVEKNVFETKYANDKEKELFEAIEHNNISQVRELLIQGGNANAKAEKKSGIKDMKYFFTPLGLAVEKKSLGIARVLLEHQADVNKLSFLGDTISYNFPKAVANEDLPMMKLLVEFKADVEAGNSGYPLVTQAKSKEILDYLIELGFDINERDRVHGFTALFLAVRDNNLELVKAILQYHPDLTIRTEATKVNAYKELTPLQWAKAAKNKEIIKVLKEAGAKK